MVEEEVDFGDPNILHDPIYRIQQEITYNSQIKMGNSQFIPSFPI